MSRQTNQLSNDDLRPIWRSLILNSLLTCSEFAKPTLLIEQPPRGFRIIKNLQRKPTCGMASGYQIEKAVQSEARL